MRSDWKLYKLGELVDFKSGGTPSKKKEQYWSGDIPWISASSMKGTRFESSDLMLTKTGIENGTTLVPKDTVLLLVRGSALHKEIPLGITSREVAFNQDVKALIPKTSRITPWYLLFVLISIRPKLLQLVESTGIGAGKLDTSVLKAIELHLPEPEEMQKLESFSKAIDDKLVLNNKTSQTLESIAQTLFKSWFVDFDPVKAKMRGEQPEGMDAATAALFPDKLVESDELGMIPEGWAIEAASDVCDISIGKTPPRKEAWWFTRDENDIPWVSIKDMGSSGTYITATSEYLTQEAVDKFKVKKVPKGTVLLSFKLTVGRVSITTCEMTTNEAIAHMGSKADQKVPASYLYLYLKQFDFESLGSTSSIARAVNSKIIKSLPLRVPAKEVLDIFDSTVSPLLSLIEEKQVESCRLENLRDTLLPKLLSGELDLSQLDTEVA